MNERKLHALRALESIRNPPEFIYKLRWALKKDICRIKDRYAIRYRGGWLTHHSLDKLLELSKY